MSGLTSVDEGAALSHPRPELLSLTGLRGLAALGVTASTVGVWRTAPTELRDLVEAGALAVPLFLLLSGFVLAYNYPGLGYSSGRRALGRYAMARFARLAPLFAVVGVCVLLEGALNGTDWVRTVFTDQAWFVGTIALCYAAYPLLARVVSSAPLVAAACAFGLDAIVLAVHLATDAGLHRVPLVWLPSFVLGMALVGFLGTRVPFAIVPVVAAYTVAVVLLLGSRDEVRYGLVWSVPLALVVLAAATSAPRWLASPLLVRLGVIGYALFLVHAVVVHGFGPVRAGTLASALLALGWIALAVLVAEGAHRYLGVPARRRLMDLARRVDRRSAPVES
ncbi:peptidoglycan/LPS O-acetylase OafA/YrhL [Kribbella amoyensis]|uniref:Peptidoglycan/LPS O-acetylase OafA/YrhL n=1 Tax=Kribbella amoyensis TaxID=996641 RepID=A0A561BKY0_9ACTN|nr:acyltransferase [Kribbella amoyensis]TWD79529.1 peptidoglycan/LPS O-acetylase OafA/YrhL [Kribbella amoyensis]